MDDNQKEVKCILCDNMVIISKKANSSRALCQECKAKGLTPPNQTKTLVCYNCGKEFEASIRGPKDIPCPDCKKLGFKSQSSVETGIKAQATLKEKYGDHPMKRAEARENARQKTLDSYAKDKEGILKKRKDNYKKKTGYDHSLQNPEVQEKIKQTMIEKYGVENYSQSEESRNVTKSLHCLFCDKEVIVHKTVGETRCVCQECKDKGLKYSDDKTQTLTCYNCGKEFTTSLFGPKDIPCPDCRKLGFKSISSSESGLKAQSIVLDKFDGIHPMNIPEIKQKQIDSLNRMFANPDRKKLMIQRSRKTYKDKTGYDHYMKDPDVLDRIRKTNLARYGVEHVLQNPEIRQRIKRTNIEKYGTPCTLQNPLIHQKSRQTLIEKYDSSHFMKSKIGKLKISRAILAKSKIRVKQQLEYLGIELLEEYTNATDRLRFKCKTCGHEYVTIWNYIQQGDKCPKCYPKHQPFSLLEKQVLDFIESIYSGQVIANSRKLLGNGKEIDIYIPDKNIAIEFDGLFWHSEAMNTPYDYHYQKTEICESLGIQLIHIFEDEWLQKQDIVKERLKQILGLSTSQKVYARNCVIKEIDTLTKNEFLVKYHIQGKDVSKIRLGAYYNDTLIAVMTFSHGNISKGSLSQDSVWELNRFCCDYNYRVIGIASKLLSYFKTNYEWSSIFSYADRRWSTGKVYQTLSFSLIKKTNPNYWYIKGDKRFHRFGLRKTKDDPVDIPEHIIRLKEGYVRIFDCGSLKFEMVKE